MPLPNRQKIKIWAGHEYHSSGVPDKVYVVWIDQSAPDKFCVNAGYDSRNAKDPKGKPKRLRIQPQGETDTIAEAERLMDIAIRKKSHYTNVESSAYTLKLFSIEEAIARIDSSRLVGYAQQPVATAPAPRSVKTQDVRPGSGRVSRSLDV